jgi:glucose-6-phosphate 1-dehydrogenase
MDQKQGDEAGRTTLVSGRVTLHGVCKEPSPEPCGLAIFGASGDLTRRKLIPALFRLFQEKLLPDRWYVVGSGRTEMEDEGFQR